MHSRNGHVARKLILKKKTITTKHTKNTKF